MGDIICTMVEIGLTDLPCPYIYFTQKKLKPVSFCLFLPCTFIGPCPFIRQVRVHVQVGKSMTNSATSRT